MSEKNKFDPFKILSEKTYDQQFEAPMSRTTKNSSGKMHGYNVNLGASKYDENLSPATSIEYDDFLNSLEDYRSKHQPWLVKSSTGVARGVAKVASEVAKMPGVLGGIAAGIGGNLIDWATGEDNTDFMQTAFNNAWINSINDAEEFVKNEFLPVYVRKAVKEGNLWDNISSIDFWATEGADGVGYIASMFLPGAAISKFNMGGKFASMFAKTEKARKDLLSGGLAGTKANIKLATLGNTLFEAGAEANSSMTSYRAEIDNKLALGEISLEEYETLKAKESEVGRNVFLANVAILLGPNTIMSNMMYGKKDIGKLGTVFDKDLGKYVTDVTAKAPTKFARVGKMLDRYGKAFASEGFFEEGGQTTAEEFFKHKALDENYDKSFLEAYLDMLGTTEGQKAIFLGGALGGGMMSFQGRREDVAKEKTASKLSDILSKGLNDFASFHKKDIFKTKEVNGQQVLDLDANGDPQLSMENLATKMKDLQGAIDLNFMYQLALGKKDIAAAEQLQDHAVASFISNFVMNGEMGIQLLEETLRNTKDIDSAFETEKNPIKAKEEFITKTLNKAKTLHRFNEMYQSFEDMIKLSDERATSQNYKDFRAKLHSNFLATVSTIDFFENKINSAQKRKTELIKNEKLQSETEEQFLENNKNDQRLLTLNKEIETSEKELEELIKKRKEFFNTGVHDKEFKKYIDELEALKNTEKIEDTLDEVKNAKSEEEVDSVLEKYKYFSKEDVKQTELKRIKRWISTINNNPQDLKTIENVLQQITETPINSYNLEKLLKDIKSRIVSLKNREKQFLNSVKILADEKFEELVNLEAELNNIPKSIEKLQKRTEVLQKSLEELNKTKFIGRNAKKIKEQTLNLISQFEEELKLIDTKITELKEKKSILERESVILDREINSLLEIIELTPKNNFKSLEEVINFVKQDKESFKKHRFSLLKLSQLKISTEQNIESLEKSISALEEYKDFLKTTLKELQQEFKKEMNISDSDPRFKNDETLFYYKGKSEKLDLIFEEFRILENEINELKKELKKEKEKDSRLLDGISYALLEEEESVLKKIEKYQKEIEKTFTNEDLKIRNLDQRLNYKKILLENAVFEKIDELEASKELEKEIENEKEEEQTEENKRTFQAFLDYVKELKESDDNRFYITSDLAAALKITGLKTGTPITIDKVTKNKIYFTFDAKQHSLDINTFFKAVKSDMFDSSTEGGLSEDFEKTQEVFSKKTSGSATDSKVLSTTAKGEKLPFVSEEFLDFERNPEINKIGKEVTFEINKGKIIKKENASIIEKQIERNRETSKEAVRLNNNRYKGFPKDHYVVELYDEKGNIVDIRSNQYKNNLQSEIKAFYDDLLKKLDNKIYEYSREGFKKEWNEAIEMFEKDPKTWDIEFLVRHLPINAVFSDTLKAPIFTYYETKEGEAASFNSSTAKMRRTILMELKAGKDIKSITTVVKNQLNGRLQIEELQNGKVVENKVFELQQFKGNVKNIKAENIYIVNDLKELRNHKNELYKNEMGRELAPGEIYLMVKTARGANFPLKLNVSKIPLNKAEVLYDLYKYRFDNTVLSKNITFEQLKQEEPELYESVLNTFEEELKIINKENIEDVRLRDIIDFMIWDGSTSPKSQVRFSGGKTTRLYVGDKGFTKTSFKTASGKEEFVNFLTENKRHHIKIRTPKNNPNSEVNFENRAYLEYLLNNGILNTNAKKEGHLFQGETSMYLDSYGVKVNGKRSSHNEEKSVFNQNQEVKLSYGQLKKDFGILDSFNLKLNKQGTRYIDSLGNEYYRTSSLKGSVTDSIEAASTVRGDVMDDLFRDFFSRSTPETFDAFLERGKEILKTVAKSKKLVDDKGESKVKISDRAFKEYYNILFNYSSYFNEKGWKVYTNLKPIGGRLGTAKDGRNKALFGGAVDVLVYDTKNQKYYLIDLKTSSVDRTTAYEKPETDQFKYKEKDSIQLSTYVELIKQITKKSGKEIKIEKAFILPLHTPKVSKTDFSINEVISSPKMLLDVNLKTKEEVNKLADETVKELKKNAVESKPTSEEINLPDVSFKFINNDSKARNFTKEDEDIVIRQLMKKSVTSYKIIDKDGKKQERVITHVSEGSTGKKDKGAYVVDLRFFYYKDGKKIYMNAEYESTKKEDEGKPFTSIFYDFASFSYKNKAVKNGNLVDLKSGGIYYEVANIHLDKSTAEKIINDKKAQLMFGFNNNQIKNVVNLMLNVWNSENNFVSLQKSKKTEGESQKKSDILSEFGIKQKVEKASKKEKVQKEEEQLLEDLDDFGLDKNANSDLFGDNELLAMALAQAKKEGISIPDSTPKTKNPQKINVQKDFELTKDNAEQFLELAVDLVSESQMSKISLILENNSKSDLQKAQETYEILINDNASKTLSQIKEKLCK